MPWTPSQLEDFFGRHSEATSAHLLPLKAGMDCRAAFVHFASADDAANAAATCDGFEIQDHQGKRYVLTCSVKQRAGERTYGNKSSPHVSGFVDNSRPRVERRVAFVSKLPLGVSERQVRELCTPCGQVQLVHILPSNLLTQACFVTMADAAETAKLIQTLNGIAFCGTLLAASYPGEREDEPKQAQLEDQPAEVVKPQLEDQPAEVIKPQLEDQPAEFIVGAGTPGGTGDGAGDRCREDKRKKPQAEGQLEEFVAEARTPGGTGDATGERSSEDQRKKARAEDQPGDFVVEARTPGGTGDGAGDRSGEGKRKKPQAEDQPGELVAEARTPGGTGGGAGDRSGEDKRKKPQAEDEPGEFAVEVRNFPHWMEAADLQVVLETASYEVQRLRIHSRDPQGVLARAHFETSEAAHAVVKALQGFGIKLGYALSLVAIPPDSQRNAVQAACPQPQPAS